MIKLDVKAIEKKHIMQSYARFDVVFESGEGCYLYDQQGKKYLDLLGGIATCSIGHANDHVTKAVCEQASKLISVSNLYYTEPQVLLAKKLSELSGLEKCFFCHSGAESNEAAIKLAQKITGKTEFIAFKNGFHGRTTGSLALTWNPKYKEAFLPLAPKVHFADYGDINSVNSLVNVNTAAVVVEPIQGEAGIVVPPTGFLKQVRELCDAKNILMIVDDVQTGVARTGKFFAFQHEEVMPDIVTVAKGLANGVPIGVCLSNFEFEAGDHGSTLGGNNLSCAAALATIEYIEQQHLAENAVNVGGYLTKELLESDAKSNIYEIRGKGLMVAIKLRTSTAKAAAKAALELGLVVNAPTDDILRLLPPLILSRAQAKSAAKILESVIAL